MDYYVGHLTKERDGSSAGRHIGNYPTLDAAIKAAQTMIDSFLLSNYQPGMTEAELFAIYKNSGEVIFILSGEDYTTNISSFNHFQYAELKCHEIHM